MNLVIKAVMAIVALLIILFGSYFLIKLCGQQFKKNYKKTHPTKTTKKA